MSFTILLYLYDNTWDQEGYFSGRDSPEREQRDIPGPDLEGLAETGYQ